MDFKELIAQADTSALDQLVEADGLLKAYKRHIRDGFMEALDYRLDDIMEDVFSANLKPLYLTCNHLLEDDPNVADDTEAAYGDMLGTANMNASLAMSVFLRDHSEALKEAVQEVIDDTVQEYRDLDLEEWAAARYDEEELDEEDIELDE